ncbi:hypothetical protein TELCIR_02551 [Teladorsagia circumcincta]|uniref:Hepatocyte growth factor-regulated tyrosine kinase substrate helical domain-containing protein n=1 Tax=Teladorsagia circumcincta TaxID=45464 RepID=A0A2G9UYT0_TELCI|nr:hypothetical protein TELCIR_02551 [Teladorsagia circumcincta]
MENRIRSNNARGRSVLNDTAIQGLFSTLTEFHSQVLAYYESLQDHLGHISEARLAIDELRAEHGRRQQERLAEEQRQRQAQMKQTLEMMRMKKHVTVMENRIRSNNARGRSVLNDTAIQGLFSTLTEFHSQVLAYYESLQDHLGHISEARLAIDELRAEHGRRQQERLAEEQRQRQAQMKQTLEMMRMKKHVMLMEQRNVALQRFQHQEMQARRGQMPQGAYYPNYGPQQPAPPQSGYPPSYTSPVAHAQQQPSLTNGSVQAHQQAQNHPQQAYYAPVPTGAPPSYQQVLKQQLLLNRRLQSSLSSPLIDHYEEKLRYVFCDILNAARCKIVT